MEQQVLELLRASQQPDSETRISAELQLQHLKKTDHFANALVTIGTHQEVADGDRLAALLALKAFVAEAWSPSLEEYGGKVLIDDSTKAAVKERLLSIVFNGNNHTKIVSVTAAVVSKIAKADFPEAWPNLLNTLLDHVPQSDDSQLQGILVVLADLVHDGLDEEAFSHCAHALIEALRGTAFDGNRTLMVRAQAVSAFRGCFDFVDMLKDRDERAMLIFLEPICEAWSTFACKVVSEVLPPLPGDKEQAEVGSVLGQWHGVIALKVQVVLTITKIQNIFPDLLNSKDLFTATWLALQGHGQPYYASFVEGDRQGSLVNVHGLPYTLDNLVIEELEYLQTLLDSPVVKSQLESLTAEGNTIREWVTQLMGSLVTFSCITAEAEGLWEIDFNVFLSEESFAETLNSPRSACASFVWKICAWLPVQTLESLTDYMKMIFQNGASSWRHKEATIYILQQIAEEYKNEDRKVDPNMVTLCIDHVGSTMVDVNHFLRARGHVVMALIMTAWTTKTPESTEIVLGFARQSLMAMGADESDVVRTSCIRLMKDYLLAIPNIAAAEMQVQVVEAIAHFLEQALDGSEADENIDVVDAILHTLRDTVMANPVTCLDHRGLNVMLEMINYGAARNDTTFVLIEEAFESAARAMAEQGPEAYARLSAKVLPSILYSLREESDEDVDKTPYMEVALNLVKLLAENAIASLPAEFINSVMPRLCRIILSDADFYLHQQSTLAIKYILSNDHEQVFSWIDPAFEKAGLEMLLMVVGRLLGPLVEDASAAEVGELAVEIVQKAGPARLGTAMRELLQVLATRLHTAKHLGLIQSLVAVFARLSLLNAADVLNFLFEVRIDDQITGLEMVLQKWLENCTHFVGFDAIRDSVTALVTIYHLHDPRLSSIQVQGDEIVDMVTSRIRTRSVAKAKPIQYTQVPAQLKLIKVLVNELIPTGNQSQTIKRYLDIYSDNEGSERSWATSSATTPNLSPSKADDATQKFLVNFFLGVGGDPVFQALYAELTADEQLRLKAAVEGQQAFKAQAEALTRAMGQ